MVWNTNEMGAASSDILAVRLNSKYTGDLTRGGWKRVTLLKLGSYGQNTHYPF